MLHKNTLRYIFATLLIFPSVCLSITKLQCCNLVIATLTDCSFQNAVLNWTQFLLCLEWFWKSLLLLFKINYSQLWAIGKLNSQYRASQEIFDFVTFWQTSFPYYLQSLFLVPLLLLFLLILYIYQRLHLLEHTESAIRHIQLFWPSSQYSFFFIL